MVSAVATKHFELSFASPVLCRSDHSCGPGIACDHARHRPTAVEFVRDALSRNPEPPGPFARRERLTGPCPRVPPVVRLFQPGSPTHIPELVAARVVDAVERMSSTRLRPDVMQER